MAGEWASSQPVWPRFDARHTDQARCVLLGVATCWLTCALSSHPELKTHSPKDHVGATAGGNLAFSSLIPRRTPRQGNAGLFGRRYQGPEGTGIYMCTSARCVSAQSARKDTHCSSIASSPYHSRSCKTAALLLSARPARSPPRPPPPTTVSLPSQPKRLASLQGQRQGACGITSPRGQRRVAGAAPC